MSQDRSSSCFAEWWQGASFDTMDPETVARRAWAAARSGAFTYCEQRPKCAVQCAFCAAEEGKSPRSESGQIMKTHFVAGTVVHFRGIPYRLTTGVEAETHDGNAKLAEAPTPDAQAHNLGPGRVEQGAQSEASAPKWIAWDECGYEIFPLPQGPRLALFSSKEERDAVLAELNRSSHVRR